MWCMLVLVVNYQILLPSVRQTDQLPVSLYLPPNIRIYICCYATVSRGEVILSILYQYNHNSGFPLYPAGGPAR